MFISEDIRYIGVDDHKIDLFEGQYVVPHGMSYNSYVIMDDKVAVLDTVDAQFKKEWLENLEKTLSGRKPDYLVVHHMEPDHSMVIGDFIKRYPEAIIVGSIGAFNMMKNLYGTDFAPNKMVVKEGEVLSLGKHSLQFIAAPNVHWPEVMFSYDKTDKVLFSADAFGKFGALDEEDEEGWACEARRYYFGIVGKFGQNVQSVLKKASGLQIEKICPLHGPVLEENLGYYLGLYDTWSKYEPEEKGVTLAYTSVYGNTKNAVLFLKEELEKRGVHVALFDLARDDMAEAVEDAFKLDRIVLATTTYCGEFFPFMKTFLSCLQEHNYQNRKVAFIENGMWMPAAIKGMKAMTDTMANITYLENNVSFKGACTDAVKEQLVKLADELKNLE
ncbi:FprA family A-type flavoprotein [Treponema rectale]|uniref:FprA family A-type flavoprotein n=1 Tax=Treponema rectale TaxID=744512 RepID=A0A7M1XJP3_9SPIR|nr:FprA family A-type flavoprotein [Treponema rectale]